MKELSKITEQFTESVIREMTRVCDAAGGINLSQGFPDFDAPEELKEAAREAIRDGYNQYPVTYGERALREAIAGKARWYNGMACDPETDITVTCGATEAMIATLKALVNPGDEVVLFEPFYENYGPDAILSGATPRYVTLYPPDWRYDPAELAAAFNERTKAIVINTPNNPTGKVFTRGELEEMAALCSKWDVFAVTDEIYEHILYDGTVHVSMASLDGMAERTVTINSLSKTYSVTGWRVGWAIASPVVTTRIRKVHDFLTVGAPHPFQKAAVFALGMDRRYYETLRERYEKSRHMLIASLKNAGFDPFIPRGAYYAIVNASRAMKLLGVRDDVSFSRRLIETTGVATVPGTSFYADGGKGMDQVRFCFCKKEETLREVGERLMRIKAT